jgi:L-amino acid N-acyltransferase YncA
MSDFHKLIIQGRAVSIREAKPGDIPATDAMHDRLSRQSLYLRYFASRKPSLESLQDQLHSSQGDGAAYVAILEGRQAEVLGLAYYRQVPGEAGSAEPAVLVEDRFQGYGLGQALMEALIHQARCQAIRSFKAYVLPENQRVLHMFAKQGLPVQRRYRDGLYELEMALPSHSDVAGNSLAASSPGSAGITNLSMDFV